MQGLLDALEEAVQQTAFEAGDSRKFSADQLRDIYRNQQQDYLEVKNAQPKVPEAPLTGLTQQLCPLLDCYRDPDSDRVGSGIAKLVGGPPEPTIADFAQVLIRAAATLGSERVVESLSGWINGEPLHYRQEALLTGVTVDQPVELAAEGVRIKPLSPDLAVKLPPFSTVLHGDKCAILSIDCKAEPALYKPSEDEMGQRDFQLTWARRGIAVVPPHTFCEALSLACNHCVRWDAWWLDFGELEEFNAALCPVMFYANLPGKVPVTQLSEEHLKEALRIHLTRHDSTEARPRLDMAISRWMKSKGFLGLKGVLGLADQFIDLRIALEALYLEDKQGKYRGEMRFRLATYGAWHLGTNSAERSKYHTAFRKAYDLASGAVHTGEVKDTPQNQKLLTTAQDLCRKGILKRLDEDPELEWDELIMGAEA